MKDPQIILGVSLQADERKVGIELAELESSDWSALSGLIADEDFEP